MPTELAEGLAVVRAALTDTDHLIRAIGSGKRRRAEAAPRVDVRPVELKSGVHLQVVTASDGAPLTSNYPLDQVHDLIDDLLERPYGNWMVETTTETIQLRVTKSGQAQVHRAATSGRSVAPRTHDRVKERLIDPDDALFGVLGAGADKRRQVDAFLRLIVPTLKSADLLDAESLHVVDIGCGNAYLTFAAHRLLADRVGAVRTVGVEQRPELVASTGEKARKAGLEGLQFVAGNIEALTAEELPLPGGRVDVALALHACDTATDAALARAMSWGATVILAAPCCHHDVQRQWKATGVGPGHAEFDALLASPILRERFADVVTDAVRADILRAAGYEVSVVEFVDSRHTPRNAMIRAVRTGAGSIKGLPTPELATSWGITPALTGFLTRS